MGKHRLPHPSLAMLLLLLLPTEVSTGQKPIYMVLIPSLLYTGTLEKGCLLLIHLNETVSVNAFMQSAKGNHSLFTDLVIDKDLFQCIYFTIPESLSDEVAFLTVQIKGPTHEFRKRRQVLIKKVESVVFVQTDKPIYKPEQTVKFRIVSLDENFLPINELIHLLYIQDPKGNRIEQWHNFKLESGLKQFSFPLSSEPLQGSYKVVIQTGTGRTIEHSFSVEEFVLPKFEVEVEVPEIITILEEEMLVSVCGKYTYGKSVPGYVTVNICRKYSHPSNCFGEESLAFCEKFSHKLDSHGCFSQVVKTKPFQLKRKEYEMQLDVIAKIQEQGTGVEETGEASTKITSTLSKVSFVNVDSHFRQGIPFNGQVLLVDGKGNPIQHKMIFIEANEANHYSNATTDKNGLVQFFINTDDIVGSSLTVRAKYKDNNVCYGFGWLTGENMEAQHTANVVFSPSKSFVHLESVPGKLPCDQTLPVQAHYILNGEPVRELKELVFYYLVMAKGAIIRSGSHIVPVEQGDMEGHFSILIRVETDLAPIARLLLFIILPYGEVVGDTVKYEIGNCLSNKVALIFNSNYGHPATHTHLTVTASPHSLCALRAVDQSVLLMKPEAELSASLVYNLLPVKDLSGFPEGADLEEEDSKDCIRQNNIYFNAILYSPVHNTHEKDMYGFLKDMGLKAFTNTNIHKPKVCEQPEDNKKVPAAYQLLGQSPMEDFLEASESPKETIRKYFPETWIWDLVVMKNLAFAKICQSLEIDDMETDPLSHGGNPYMFAPIRPFLLENPGAGITLCKTEERVCSIGMAEREIKVPDTITKWKAGALCLSNYTGLGLSPMISFEVFQPFFLELTMPYSVIRGETFTLKATVLNYLHTCIRVSVHLRASPHFLTAPLEDGQEPHCICSDEHHTVSWVVTPKSLGKVNFTVSAEALNSQKLCGHVLPVVPEHGKRDTVIKSLLVEAEGLENEVTINSVHCPSGSAVSERISLTLPPDVVEDSAQASFKVVGDILGPAMHNTQDLLKMPYGCGEQNMVLFAPNIYILDYLNETQQLTKETKKKAIEYLNMGYQRQLNYKHQDGAYSTFGDKPGRNSASTWLTAFVLKNFAQARKYIFIHEVHITQALLWLSHQQKDNGCFRSSGSPLNNAIKGGIEDEITLSAYITIALLEMPLPITHTVVRNALFCLDTAWKLSKEGIHGSHVYTKVLLAYAFALAGNQDVRAEILKSLHEESVKEDNSIHWIRPQKRMMPVSFWYQPQAASAEIEMTAYVLLAYLTTQPAPTEQDLTTATLIVKWLSKQQNSHGGFSSTQDTVVALHALSKYATATFTGAKKVAQVTIYSSDLFSTKFQVDDDNQLLQQRVELPTVPGDYTARVTGEGCVYLQTSLKYNVFREEKAVPFALVVQTLPRICDDLKAHTSFQILLNISYTGRRSDSNMVIADVKIVSGFIPLKPTVKMLERSVDVSRAEVSKNHVFIYLNKVSNQTINLSFTVQQDIPIRYLKPAIVQIYDYYEKDDFVVAEYSAPCSKDYENV